MMYFNDLLNAVHKGAEWLDHFNPEWSDMIDVEILELGSVDECILGQLGLIDDYSIAWMREHGFWQPRDWSYVCEDRDDEEVDTYDLLTDMWKYELAQRV